MNDRKILIFIPFLILYCLYCLNMWFTEEDIVEEEVESMVAQLPKVIDPPDVTIIEKEVTIKTIHKYVPLLFYNACSILDVFTEKPIVNIRVNKTMLKESDGSNHTIAVIGIMVFLVALAINAIMDVLKVKEEEKERRKLNPSGERRQSLAEFANKKHFRRQSSRFGLQLFQIAESATNNEEEKTSRRQSRPYTRGDSTNSYLSDRKPQPDGSTPTESTEPRLVKRQSVAKLFDRSPSSWSARLGSSETNTYASKNQEEGLRMKDHSTFIRGRPVPMVRRSSFPALPLNPDVQALMLGHRQPSLDSDDEGDGKGRRVRIIRRY